jgi:hypothetical protein
VADKGPGLLSGVIIGAVIGAAVTFWLVERSNRPGRRGIGTRGGIIGFLKDEVFGGVRDYIQQAIEEGRETADSTRSDIEERFREEEEK